MSVEELSVEELSAALGEGDPAKVAALIEAGADIHYRREEGYDALVDAVHSRDVARDPRLLELLALLVAHGVELSGVTEYAESGLRVLSRLGRFDAVRLLLEAGADRGQLGWSPLMEAVALGSLAGVEDALSRGAALEERDWWSRTAWLIAVMSGDVARAKLLRERGADPGARGRGGATALSLAIRGHHPDMVRWLLQEGADVDQVDEFGATALMAAVEEEDVACVDILLEAGADVDVDSNGTALERAASRDIALRLLDAGADPAHLTYDGQRALLGLRDEGEEALAAVSVDDYRRAFTRSFGKSNPERMNNPFWDAMIRSGVSAYSARARFEEAAGRHVPPVWCARRFGQSLTLLPGGRAIQIGGEHEDFYDADFCIYNDVFVHEPDGSIAIYGYPEDVFAPADFHTATLLGDFLHVIGSAGYQESRGPGETRVYRLELRTLRMERLDTSGDAPGWVYGHRAIAASPHEIRVWGGKVVTGTGKDESHGPLPGSFVLDLSDLRWRREPPDGGARGKDSRRGAK